MIENFYAWIELWTKEKFLSCVLVMTIAAVSLGFCIGKGVEYSLQENQVRVPSDNYKLDVIQSEANGK